MFTQNFGEYPALQRTINDLETISRLEEGQKLAVFKTLNEQDYLAISWGNSKSLFGKAIQGFSRTVANTTGFSESYRGAVVRRIIEIQNFLLKQLPDYMADARHDRELQKKIQALAPALLEASNRLYILKLDYANGKDDDSRAYLQLFEHSETIYRQIYTQLSRRWTSKSLSIPAKLQELGSQEPQSV